MVKRTQDERKTLENGRQKIIRKLQEIEDDPSIIDYWKRKGINVVKIYNDNLDKIDRLLGYR